MSQPPITLQDIYNDGGVNYNFTLTLIGSTYTVVPNSGSSASFSYSNALNDKLQIQLNETLIIPYGISFSIEDNITVFNDGIISIKGGIFIIVNHAKCQLEGTILNMGTILTKPKPSNTVNTIELTSDSSKLINARDGIILDTPIKITKGDVENNSSMSGVLLTNFSKFTNNGGLTVDDQSSNDIGGDIINNGTFVVPYGNTFYNYSLFRNNSLVNIDGGIELSLYPGSSGNFVNTISNPTYISGGERSLVNFGPLSTITQYSTAGGFTNQDYALVRNYNSVGLNSHIFTGSLTSIYEPALM